MSDLQMATASRFGDELPAMEPIGEDRFQKRTIGDENRGFFEENNPENDQT